MQDLTVIFLTAGLHPQKWKDYQKKVLLEAIQDKPLIVVTRNEEVDILRLSTEYILDDGVKSHANMYWQLLKACKLAKTKYIATAEDDVLYSREHFDTYRPSDNAVSYDMSRWSLFTWNPIYNLKQRVSNCTLIAPREYLIEALEERFNKFPVDIFPPELVSEVGRYEKNIGVTERNLEKFYSDVPCIQLNHPNGTDSTQTRKKMGQIKALDIPYWGKAEDIIKLYE